LTASARLIGVATRTSATTRTTWTAIAIVRHASQLASTRAMLAWSSKRHAGLRDRQERRPPDRDPRSVRILSTFSRAAACGRQRACPAPASKVAPSPRSRRATAGDRPSPWHLTRATSARTVIDLIRTDQPGQAITDGVAASRQCLIELQPAARVDFFDDRFRMWTYGEPGVAPALLATSRTTHEREVPRRNADQAI
jgi:hypothetical protein